MTLKYFCELLGETVLFKTVKYRLSSMCAVLLRTVDLTNLILTRNTFNSICGTEEYGDYVSGPRVITPEVKENMKAVLADIQSGAFATRFMEDQKAGAPEFKALRKKGEEHPIETTGRELRSLFSWISDSSSDDYVDGSVAR